MSEELLTELRDQCLKAAFGLHGRKKLSGARLVHLGNFAISVYGGKEIIATECQEIIYEASKKSACDYATSDYDLERLLQALRTLTVLDELADV